jgi:RNase H-like domain found in reverse transcriptase
VNYYQKFIHQYAHITTPLNELLRKESHGNEVRRNEALKQLKKALQKALVLRIVEERRKFRIETDTSDVAIKAVLLQQ